MGKVRKPLVPGGPIREFFDRLHAIHLAAGQPSMRELRRRTRGPRSPGGINQTTIHNAFSAPRLAAWETVERIVVGLGGDVAEFAELWQRGRVAETLLATAPHDTAAALDDTVGGSHDTSGDRHTANGQPTPAVHTGRRDAIRHLPVAVVVLVLRDSDAGDGGSVGQLR